MIPVTAPIIGLEHEFYLSRDGDRVDFRRIIDDLELPGRRIDPADKRAYRLFSGHVITCDDEEAEYAIAPVALRSGFAQLVDRACRGVAGDLRTALGPDIEIKGASTHVSVSCPDQFARRVCAMITQHFAPALMLIAEDNRSFGLLVRPRYGRVEFGVDYVSDTSLRALVAMAAGAVQACLAVLERRLSPSSLPHV